MVSVLPFVDTIDMLYIYIYYICMCDRVYVFVSGQNLTNQFVNWQPGIFNLVVISGCQNPNS